jgi:hypothetical protein
MKKILTYFVVTVVVLFALVVVAGAIKFNFSDSDVIVPKNDARNTTYYISDVPYTLVNGVAESESAPGSSTKTVTKYFGNEVSADIDSDGRVDEIFILTQETGGSGTFFYVAAALNKETGYVGSHAVYIGDRIAPQNINIDDKNIIVLNYADRAPGESFAVEPALGKTIYLKYDVRKMELSEFVKHFKGEVDPPLYCKNRGGVWYPRSNVCEINSLSEGECVAQGGIFNECASACRHNPEAEMCTMQCVVTCSFVAK